MASKSVGLNGMFTSHFNPPRENMYVNSSDQGQEPYCVYVFVSSSEIKNDLLKFAFGYSSIIFNSKIR